MLIKGKIGFLQIYFEDSLSNILERNSKRKGKQKVSEETIMKMATKLELPSTECWEKNHFLILNVKDWKLDDLEK